MRQAIAKYWKPLYGRIQDWNVNEGWLRDPKNVRLFANFQREWYAHGVATFHLTAHTDEPSKAPDVFAAAIDSTLEQAVIQTSATADSLDEAKVAGDLVYLFEGIAEHESDSANLHHRFSRSQYRHSQKLRRPIRPSPNVSNTLSAGLNLPTASLN